MRITPPPADLPKDFYVYEHRKATTGEVFYIGKGCGRRAWRHGPSKRSEWWNSTARKHGVIVRIVIDGLQEWAAAEIESELIALHGRNDIGYGQLVNFTDGGDGVSGQIQGDATRAKRAASVAKALSDPSTKARLIEATSGGEFLAARAEATKRWWTGERRAARAAQAAARWSDPEFKKVATESMRRAAKQRPVQARPVICIETGAKFESAVAAADWLKLNGHPRAQNAPILYCCKGIRNRSSAYGHTWRYAE